MRGSLTTILRRVKFRSAVLLLVASAAVAAFCICDSLIAWHAFLWPADINAVVVHWMGGSEATSVVGETRFAVPWVSVFVRLLATVLTPIVIGCSLRRFDRSAMQELTPAVIGMALALLAGASWWLLTLLQGVSLSIDRFAVLALPVWVMLSLALVCWFALRLVLRKRESCSPVIPAVVLAAGIVLWIAISFWMNLRLYENVLIPHGDSAMYEEHLWNVREGKGFRSYLDQGLFWGEHFQFIHLFLLPLHVMWPSHLMLEFAETLALASCAIPVFLMTRRSTGSAWAGALLGLAWLFYFPMHYLDIAVDLKTFRPLALGLPFLFWMIEFCERRRFGVAFVCLAVALSAKEDVALVTCPLLTVMAWQVKKADGTTANGSHSFRWLSGMAAFSLVWLLFVVLVGIPGFRAGESVHYSRYFGDLGSSPGELVRNAVTRPNLVLGRFFSPRTLLYVLFFLGPLALIPFRRSFLLLACLASFSMLSLLQLETDDTGLPLMPYHHFHAPLLPVLYWACAAGLSRNRSDDKETAVRLSGLVLLCCITTSVTGSLMPFGATFWSSESAIGRRLYSQSDEVIARRGQMAEVVEDLIPRTARVAATDYIHTRLTHCERSYDYSDYPRAVNDYLPGVPADTDFIVIDTTHRYSTYRSPEEIPELRDSPEVWELTPDTTNGVFVILRRRDSDQRLNSNTQR